MNMKTEKVIKDKLEEIKYILYELEDKDFTNHALISQIKTLEWVLRDGD